MSWKFRKTLKVTIRIIRLIISFWVICSLSESTGNYHCKLNNLPYTEEQWNIITIADNLITTNQEV